jgi:predicted GNAT superfamily acetyltransferase
MTITLKLVKTVEGCDHFIALQQIVWGSDPLDVVPNHVTVTLLKNGGALLGAYAEDGPVETGGMVGAALWWIGIDDRYPSATRPDDPSLRPAVNLKICSHMAGVLPQWQGRGVGRLLKLKQRELVLQQGLTELITWTYDPLQRVNGVLNIHRLGATCRTYLRNVYGVMRDALNAGTPSDRFQVDWHLRSERVVGRIEGAGSREQEAQRAPQGKEQVLPTIINRQGLQQPVESDWQPDGEPIAVPIPDDIGAVRRADAGLGLAWRLYTRSMFETAFGAGYVAVDCVQWPAQGWCYILESAEGESRA